MIKMKTYHWFVFLMLIWGLFGCAGADMEGGYQEDSEVYEEEKMSAADAPSEAAAAEYTEEESEGQSHVYKDIWSSKAKQQLESLEDFILILKDNSIASEFKYEVEKELKLIYLQEDTILNYLMSQDVKFKNIKNLETLQGDTMSLSFKNHKEAFIAKFIVVSETKDFGETTETIERLKLVSIQKL